MQFPERIRKMETKLQDPVRKPELEASRDLVLNAEKEDLKGITELLAKELSNIHAAFLFIEESGIRVVKTMCLLLTSTSDNVIHSDWKDLGAALGLTYNQLLCIINGNYKFFDRSSDYTENTLITFAQHRNATIGEMLKALLKISRFDVIRQVIKDLKELVQKIKLNTNEIEQFNSEYYILNSSPTITDNGSRETIGILRPPGYEFIKYRLPITLAQDVIPATFTEISKTPVSQIETNTRNRIEERKLQVESIQQSQVIAELPQKPIQYSKLVMLTFAADGEGIARNIAKMFYSTYINNLPFGVLILQDHKNDVLSNPEQFISHLFPQMDYIVPILTEGYFEALSGSVTTAGCIDERYVQFVHDLMAKYYVKNQCRNKKVRCVIANCDMLAIQKHSRFQNEPILQAWCKESDSEDFIRSMTRHR